MSARLHLGLSVRRILEPNTRTKVRGRLLLARAIGLARLDAHACPCAGPPCSRSTLTPSKSIRPMSSTGAAAHGPEPRACASGLCNAAHPPALLRAQRGVHRVDVQLRDDRRADAQWQGGARAPSTALTTHPATTLATAALAAGILCATALATAARATRTLSAAHLLPPTSARHRRQCHHPPRGLPPPSLLPPSPPPPSPPPPPSQPHPNPDAGGGAQEDRVPVPHAGNPVASLLRERMKHITPHTSASASASASPSPSPSPSP